MSDEKEKIEENMIKPTTIIMLDPIIPTEKDLYLFDFYVAGCSYIYDIKWFISKIKKDTVLYLSLEPYNKFDKMAIKVCTREINTIGYVPRSINYVMAKLIEAGKTLYLKVKNVDKDDIKVEVSLFLKE